MSFTPKQAFKAVETGKPLYEVIFDGDIEIRPVYIRSVSTTGVALRDFDDDSAEIKFDEEWVFSSPQKCMKAIRDKAKSQVDAILFADKMEEEGGSEE